MQQGRNSYIMYYHAAAQIREVELFSIMGAKIFRPFYTPLVQHICKSKQQLFFIIIVKRFYYYFSFGRQTLQHAATDANYFSKFSINSCAAINTFRRFLFFVAQQ